MIEILDDYTQSTCQPTSCAQQKHIIPFLNEFLWTPNQLYSKKAGNDSNYQLLELSNVTKEACLIILWHVRASFFIPCFPEDVRTVQKGGQFNM